MKRKGIIIGTIIIIILCMSNATAVKHVQSNAVDKIIENKNNFEISFSELIDFDNIVKFIIKILQFIQNLTSILLTLLSPLAPILNIITEILENLLEKLEPWGILGEAILDVIDAIYALIEAIQNIINPPE